jgi:outer membrane putative beta-barrel porin/alpha-amylase
LAASHNARSAKKYHASLCAFLLLTFLAGAHSTNAQDRPLQTSDAEVVPPGAVRAEVGFDFLQDVTFPLSGLSGDMTNISAVNIRTGIGKIVEIQVQGMIQEFLSIKDQGASFVTLNLPNNNSTHDIGDFSLWTKILLLSEEGRRPAVAFRFGFEMPNSNETKGLGNNATNIYSEAILEKHFGKLTAFGDLGIAILTSPNALYSQNDELMYGAAFRYALNKRANLVGEIAGLYTPRKITPALLGTESRGQGRLGVQITAGGLIWDFAGIAGLTRNDPRTGFTFGVSKEIQLFNRTRPSNLVQ